MTSTIIPSKRGRKKKPPKKYYKYFPFAPGLKYCFQKKYLIPEIDIDQWKSFVENRDIIVTAFGGPLEAFFSLAYIEMLVSFFSKDKKISYIGNSNYNYFLYAQGLSKLSNINLTKNILGEYPVPLFLDAKENVYYNALNNYIIKTSYWGLYPTPNKDPLLKQIFDNSLVPWENKYIPKIRNKASNKFNNWKKLNNFSERKKTILIFPDKQGSVHHFYCGLKWNEHNIREFAALLYGKGFQILVCSDKTFHGTNIKTFKNDPELIIGLLQQAWMVLSEAIDWHLIGIMLSNCISLSLINKKHDLFNEIEYIKRENLIYIENELSPFDVKNTIEALC